MHTVTTIGLDIAKSVFQVHGVDAVGQVVIRRQLKRRYVLAFFQKLSPCVEASLKNVHLVTVWRQCLCRRQQRASETRGAAFWNIEYSCVRPRRLPVTRPCWTIFVRFDRAEPPETKRSFDAIPFCHFPPALPVF